MAVKTYWNGEPCIATRVRVIVGKAEKPTLWYAGLEGTERRAVEVVYGDQTFYLDDDFDLGWFKVTEGRGLPNVPHGNLAVERVVARLDVRGRDYTKPRGFAAIDPQRHREIASMGGKAAQAAGKAHRFTPAEAREAGRKGGNAAAQNLEHMRKIGTAGGLAISQDREHMRKIGSTGGKHSKKGQSHDE